VARTFGREAYLVDSAADLNPEWVAGKSRVGVTAGASAPEVLVHEVIVRLQSFGVRRVQELEGREETTVFPLPRAMNPSAGMPADSKD
jgi:4-hydroxy-3-methylbut-2-enyl diphosphate reductase